MARALIVSGGDRGRRLAAALIADGLAVRVVAEDPRELPAFEDLGAEGVLADPDRIGTLMESLAGVTVLCWLMGSPAGAPERGTALHGDRLRMLFEKLVDTPVRGVVYEAAGTLPSDVYTRGSAIACAAADTWALPVEILQADPAATESWTIAARMAVTRLLTTSDPGGR